MRVGLIARKVGMGACFSDANKLECVTYLYVDDCVVVGSKNLKRDGYDSVILATENVQKSSKVSKPLRGFFKTLEIDCKKKIKEFRISGEANFLKPKTVLNVDHFSKGQFVDILSKSIGKGFAGAMKRHGFKGLETTHGVSISHRSHGSTGGCQNPGKVFKNKKMAGHMGCKNVTIQNLKILEINSDKKCILVKGSIPGKAGAYVYIKDAVKKRFV